MTGKLVTKCIIVHSICTMPPSLKSEKLLVANLKNCRILIKYYLATECSHARDESMLKATYMKLNLDLTDG